MKPKPITTAELLDLLSPARLNACREAREWVAMQPDAKIAWETCANPDWMLWYSNTPDPIQRPGVAFARVRFAEDALQWIPAEDEETRATCEGVNEVSRRRVRRGDRGERAAAQGRARLGRRQGRPCRRPCRRQCARLAAAAPPPVPAELGRRQ